MGNGQVFFPGTCPLDQLRRIISIVGKPSRDLIARHYQSHNHTLLRLFPSTSENNEEDDKEGNIIAALQKLLPGRSELAYDLLAKMLRFDQEQRISAEESLKHPYFSDWYDPFDVKRCEKKIDFSFEDQMVDSLSTKRLCYDTIMEFSREKKSG